MKREGYFFYGMFAGAWLNIWPPAIGLWAGFIFAYMLLPVAVFYGLKR